MKRKSNGKHWTLLIRGGRVIDPQSGFDKTADVAIAGERIAAIGPKLYEGRPDDVRVINASGAIVLPGLIDLHAHVFEHFTGDFGLHADLVGVESGVTALVDQGGPSALTIEGFRKHVVERSASRVVCFISNYLVGGLHGHKYVELYGPHGVDPAAIVAATEANRDLVKGVKAHAEPGGYSRWGLEPLRLAKEAARHLKIPVYVHLGTLWSPKDRAEIDTNRIVKELIPLLDAGDILAHPYTRYPSGMVGPDGKVHPLVLEAMQKGVRFDVGRGSHISFENARRAIDAGVVPFTVGADLHGYNVARPKGRSWYRGTFAQQDEASPEFDEFSFVSPYSLHHAMSEMRALGLPLLDVFRMATCNSAQVLGLDEELGRLAVGRYADLSIVNVLEGRWVLRDSLNQELVASEMIHPRLAIRGGKVHRANSPLLPDLARLAA